LPAYDGLQRIDNLGGNHHRVNAHPGSGTVRLPAFYLYGEPVGSRHHAFLFVADGTELADRLDMHSEYDIYFGILQDTFLYHEFRAPLFPYRRAFRRRLK